MSRIASTPTVAQVQRRVYIARYARQSRRERKVREHDFSPMPLYAPWLAFPVRLYQSIHLGFLNPDFNARFFFHIDEKCGESLILTLKIVLSKIQLILFIRATFPHFEILMIALLGNILSLELFFLFAYYRSSGKRQLGKLS